MKLQLISNSQTVQPIGAGLSKFAREARRLWEREIKGRKLLGFNNTKPQTFDAVTLAFYAWRNEIEALSCELEMKHATFLHYKIQKRLCHLKTLFILRYKYFFLSRNIEPLGNLWINTEYKEFCSQLSKNGTLEMLDFRFR